MTSAWAYFRERLDEIAAACGSVASDPRASQPVTDALSKASAALQRIADPISFQPNGLTWDNGISQLFSPMDIDHMSFLVDLAAYDAVRTQTAVWDVISQKAMPLDPLGAWTDRRIGWFKQWMDSNFPQ
jgi:hypothetical protein